MWNFIYWILFVLSLAGLGVFLFCRREDRAVASLALTFASLGGIFALMGHAFLGTILVMLYAGAVIVGFIVVVWLIVGKSGEGKSLVTISSIVFLAVAFEVIVLLSWKKAPFKSISFSTAELGVFFMKDYLYLFELTSLLILTAVVSSLVILRRRK